MGNQRNQSILLAVGELPKTLQQFAFVQGQLRAVKAHAWLVAKCTFLNQALFESSDDFGVHAAVVIFRHFSYAFTHAVWQTYDELVSRAAGINSLFYWAHIVNR